MPQLCDLRAVRLFGRRRRCSSFPDKIPAAETRRRRHQIGLAPTTRQASGGHQAGALTLLRWTIARSASSSRSARTQRSHRR
jgi:hypothetical protein